MARVDATALAHLLLCSLDICCSLLFLNMFQHIVHPFPENQVLPAAATNIEILYRRSDMEGGTVQSEKKDGGYCMEAR